MAFPGFFHCRDHQAVVARQQVIGRELLTGEQGAARVEGPLVDCINLRFGVSTGEAAVRIAELQLAIRN